MAMLILRDRAVCRTRNRYWHKTIFDQIDNLKALCEEHGTNLVSASFRWMRHHSSLSGTLVDIIALAVVVVVVLVVVVVHLYIVIVVARLYSSIHTVRDKSLSTFKNLKRITALGASFSCKPVLVFREFRYTQPTK